MYAVGVDIGGTKVALGIVSQDGKIVDKKTVPTNLKIKPEAFIRQLCQEIDQLLEASGIDWTKVEGVGVGAPGPLDTRNGKIACPPNLLEWKDFPIVQAFQSHLDVSVYFENDATAAALAEKWVGAAQENDYFVYITISTGIGAGLYLNGRLMSGFTGNAGDIGHMVIDPSYGKCVCGQEGCFEAIASGTAIARHGSRLLGAEHTTKEIFDLYRQHHPKVVPFMEDVFKVIGRGCVSVINFCDPEKIVLGGGVTKAGDLLFEPVRRYVAEFALSPAGKKTEIVPSGLGQDTGLLGAAALVLRSEALSFNRT